jgi:hypothetical protein
MRQSLRKISDLLGVQFFIAISGMLEDAELFFLPGGFFANLCRIVEPLARGGGAISMLRPPGVSSA